MERRKIQPMTINSSMILQQLLTFSRSLSIEETSPIKTLLNGTKLHSKTSSQILGAEG